MVCAACGASVVDGVRFCARCGAAVAAAPAAVVAAPAAGQGLPVAGHYAVPYARQPRVQPRLQTLGTFWCVYALYRVIAAAIGMLVLRAFTLRSFDGLGWPFHHLFDARGGWARQGPGAWGGLLQVIAVVTVISVALAAFTGWSLLQRKPWGRTLSIVAAILALLKFPFGTALGIYTLWVMVPADSAMEWDAIAEPE